jgi:hypothetical protein
MNENKKQRFKRLAVSRVNKAVKSIELIGNLGNTSLYESTPEERKKIIKAVNDSVVQMKIELDGKSKKKDGFHFD